MKYQKPSFTVPASSTKSPENCHHGWIDWKRERCVLCGAPVPALASLKRTLDRIEEAQATERRRMSHRVQQLPDGTRLVDITASVIPR